MGRPIKRGLTNAEQRKAEQARFDKNLEEHLLDGKHLKYIHEIRPTRYTKNRNRAKNYGEYAPTYFKEKEKTIWRKHLCREELRKEQRIIVKYALNHPLRGIDNIAKDLWVDPKRVKDLLNRYQRIKMFRKETQEQDLVNMYDGVLADIAEITARNIKAYKESDERLRTWELKDLSTIAKETQERKNLLEGTATSNQNINITFN